MDYLSTLYLYHFLTAFENIDWTKKFTQLALQVLHSHMDHLLVIYKIKNKSCDGILYTE